MSRLPTRTVLIGDTVKWIGFAAGPLLAALTLFLLPEQFATYSLGDAATSVPTPPSTVPTDTIVEGTTEPMQIVPFTWAGRATFAVLVWMAVWWLTETLDIRVTALLPVVVFPLLGIADIRDTCAPYAHPLVFLYLGGFLIALSMQRWGLGKRIALMTLAVVGTSARSMVGGFMLVTAFLSAFVSNTATTAMMLPIALSVIELLRARDDSSESTLELSDRFATCLLLSIAYAASIGGISTIIGTPPNAFLVGFLRDQIAPGYRQELTFLRWLPIGLSVTVVFLPIVYWMLTSVLFPLRRMNLSAGNQLVRGELRRLGPVQRGEWITLGIFVLVVTLWLIRPLLAPMEIPFGEGEQRQVVRPFENLSDPLIAMFGAVLLFAIPVDPRHRAFTMDWQTATRVPWGILILFGGGLSLASAIGNNGVAEYLGSLVADFAGLPPLLIVLMVAASVVFLTELTSNAATTASLVPVLAALASGLNIHPYLLIFPASIAASCAFMLPVATPPNAIVFGSGAISVQQMARAGLLLNLLAVGLITLVTYFVIIPWLNIEANPPM